MGSYQEFELEELQADRSRSYAEFLRRYVDTDAGRLRSSARVSLICVAKVETTSPSGTRLMYLS